MALPRLFKLPSYNKFTYYPRYFDPDKEALDKRKRQIEKEVELEEQGRVPIRFKKGISRDGYFYRRQKSERRSTIRFFVILAGLLAIAYYLLYW